MFKFIGYIFTMIGNLFGLSMCLIFISIGACVICGGIINIRSVDTYNNTPITSFNSIKAGNVIKIVAEPLMDQKIVSPNLKIPVVFYTINYNKYYSSKGSPSKNTYKTELKPDYIAFKYLKNFYRINVQEIKPKMFFKNTATYILDKSKGNYVMTTKSNFSVNDNTIEENVILPTDKVLIFGYLKDIKIASNGYKILILDPNNMGNPFEDPLNFVKKLFSTIIENKLSLYIVSTKPPTETIKDFVGFSGYFMLGFGLFFLIIPLVILAGIILSTVRSTIKLFMPY